jgi:hypothetical protein
MPVSSSARVALRGGKRDGACGTETNGLDDLRELVSFVLLMQDARRWMGTA